MSERDTESPSESHAGTAVLFVDDDLDVLDTGADLLRELGYRVTACRSGTAALDYLHGDDDVALLITDFSMPGMNGITLARNVRDFRPNLPIILCTGHVREVDVNAAQEAGVTDFYVKPMALDTLGRLTHHVLADAAGEA